MNIKNFELRQVLADFNTLAGLRLSGKMAFTVVKAKQHFTNQLTSFEEARTTLLKGFAKLDEKGEIVSENEKAVFNTPDDEKSFTTEFSKLAMEEVPTIPVTLTEEEVVNIADITAGQMSVLFLFVKQAEEAVVEPLKVVKKKK